METFGVWLRQKREARGSTLAEVEADTRIRIRFLEMLEAGHFVAVPGGDVQIRGFLRIYARYLELSPGEVLGRYDADLHSSEFVASSSGPAAAGPMPSAVPAPDSVAPPSQGFSIFTASRRTAGLPTVIVAGILLVVALTVVAAGGYYLSRGTGEQASAADVATQPPDAALPSAVAETPVLTVATPTFPANSELGVTLELESTERVWVRVKSDDQTVFEGLISPEQPQSWSGERMVVVECGNGAGLLVTVNGQPQGLLGERGRISLRAWGPDGEIDVPPPTPMSTS